MGNIRQKVLISSLISSIGLAILGGLLIFKSEFAILSVSYTIGAILVAIGVLALLDFVKRLNEGNKNELDIVYGIVTVIMGIMVISNPETVASIIPFIIGVMVIINSAMKLQYGIELRKNNNSLWKSTMIVSIIMLLCGVLLVFNPFKGAEFFIKTVGIFIFIYALLDIISTLTIKNTVKKFHTEIDEHIKEAEIVKEEESKKEEEKTETSQEKNTKKNNKEAKENKKEEESGEEK